MGEEQSPTKRPGEDAAAPARRVKHKTSADVVKTGPLFTHPTHKLMEAGIQPNNH